MTTSSSSQVPLKEEPAANLSTELFTILVVGGASSGRSSLISAFAGSHVRPPPTLLDCQKLATVYQISPDGVKEVTDKMVKSMESLTDLPAEKKKDKFTLFRLWEQSKFLKCNFKNWTNVQIIDVPGIPADPEKAKDALELIDHFAQKADLILFVTTAEQPLSNPLEKECYSKLDKLTDKAKEQFHYKRLFLVLNKADHPANSTLHKQRLQMLQELGISSLNVFQISSHQLLIDSVKQMDSILYFPTYSVEEIKNVLFNANVFGTRNIEFYLRVGEIPGFLLTYMPVNLARTELPMILPSEYNETSITLKGDWDGLIPRIARVIWEKVAYNQVFVREQFTHWRKQYVNFSRQLEKTFAQQQKEADENKDLNNNLSQEHSHSSSQEHSDNEENRDEEGDKQKYVCATPEVFKTNENKEHSKIVSDEQMNIIRQYIRLECYAFVMLPSSTAVDEIRRVMQKLVSKLSNIRLIGNHFLELLTVYYLTMCPCSSKIRYQMLENIMTIEEYPNLCSEVRINIAMQCMRFSKKEYLEKLLPNRVLRDILDTKAFFFLFGGVTCGEEDKKDLWDDNKSWTMIRKWEDPKEDAKLHMYMDEWNLEECENDYYSTHFPMVRFLLHYLPKPWKLLLIYATMPEVEFTAWRRKQKVQYDLCEELLNVANFSTYLDLNSRILDKPWRFFLARDHCCKLYQHQELVDLNHEIWQERRHSDSDQSH
jgi:GTPase SAR1 family protein